MNALTFGYVLMSSSMQRLVCVLILSRLNYCNSVGWSPSCNTGFATESHARCSKSCVAHLSLSMIPWWRRWNLHWLSITYCIMLCLMMHAAVNSRSPAYITVTLVPTSSRLNYARLRSLTSGTLMYHEYGHNSVEELVLLLEMNFQSLWEQSTMFQV